MLPNLLLQIGVAGDERISQWRDRGERESGMTLKEKVSRVAQRLHVRIITFIVTWYGCPWVITEHNLIKLRKYVNEMFYNFFLSNTLKTYYLTLSCWQSTTV